MIENILLHKYYILCKLQYSKQSSARLLSRWRGVLITTFLIALKLLKS